MDIAMRLSGHSHRSAATTVMSKRVLSTTEDTKGPTITTE